MNYKIVNRKCLSNSNSKAFLRGTSISKSKNLSHISSRMTCLIRAHKVEITHQGMVHVLEVPEGKTILEVALENDLDLLHDCKMGVCMTCPARLVSGEVDQSASVLSEDVAERGYALLCVSEPQTDCEIKTIPEDELLDLQLVTSAQ